MSVRRKKEKRELKLESNTKSDKHIITNNTKSYSKNTPFLIRYIVNLSRKCLYQLGS